MKTTVANLSTVVQARVQRDLKAAAGTNGVLSKAEQKKAPEYLQRAADEFRQANPGKRVSVGALETLVTKQAKDLIGAVNQPKGAGSTVVSQAEAKEAARRDATLGFAVLEAYRVVSGQGVEAIVKQHVAPTLDEDSVYRTFKTENEAMNAHDANGRHIVWSVRTEEGLLKDTYVSGKNDLWAQRFEVDKLSGAITITGEH